ncbi:hemerythrin domain-containing protein [Actinoplanes sp. NPDC049596]|uniref:hemerythrin domain-containing protein n=1 Tax=unclassified Actinoplanes TaxID=2626549 RepID=UPI003426CC43
MKRRAPCAPARSLEADHRIVAHLLDEIESAAHHLDEPRARTHLATALTELSTHLLDHLTREEQALAPVLSTWQRWPAA